MCVKYLSSLLTCLYDETTMPPEFRRATKTTTALCWQLTVSKKHHRERDRRGADEDVSRVDEREIMTEEQLRRMNTLTRMPSPIQKNEMRWVKCLNGLKN